MATHCFEGILESTPVHIGLTLGSGQVFRWGRDVDGWWKGIAYGVVVHLRQVGDQIQYRASSERVATYCGEMAIDDFLRWYLRLDHMPRIRVPREDTHLRKARDLLKGLQFVRQDPFECIISYVLSVQAHMSLTKKRIGFIARTDFTDATVLAGVRSGWLRPRGLSPRRCAMGQIWIPGGVFLMICTRCLAVGLVLRWRGVSICSRWIGSMRFPLIPGCENLPENGMA